jgi:comEA protein
MYSGMTRNEVRGILALVLVAALGVGARTYLSDSPRSGVWVERPLKQSSAVLHATPIPVPTFAVPASPPPTFTPTLTPMPSLTPAGMSVPPSPVPPPVPTHTPPPMPHSSTDTDASQTVVIAPNLPNAQSVVIAPNAPQAQSVTFSGATQPSPTATVAATPHTVQPTTSASRGKAASTPLASSINLNIATLADLDKLPGIGPKTAQKIIDYRTKTGPFRSVDDLLNVSGIGPKTLEKIRPSVKVN